MISPGRPPAPEKQRCDDLAALRPRAEQGKLTAAERACLKRTAFEPDRKQTEREERGGIFLADARARCEEDLAQCTDYERVQPRFFEEVSRSDVELVYAWAMHLHKHDRGAPNDAMRWAYKALPEKHQWDYESYSERVDDLYELIAREANEALKEQRGTIKAARNAAKDWVDSSTAAEHWGSRAAALSLCVEAYGEEWCGKNTDDPGQIEVKFTSQPPGAEVYADGRRLCATNVDGQTCEKPLETPSSAMVERGIHSLEMRFDGPDGETRVQGRFEVSDRTKNEANGFLWWSCERDSRTCTQRK